MNGGKVYLVGAGPGEPELLTLKGLRLIESADAIVHDRLIDARLLDMANPNATILDVGKLPGERGRTQANINDLLIREARLGKAVVRLKGGDPFVFGRGGEEAEALSDAGIPFEIVPGVTSAVAAPAYAGIPLTHRDYASSFTVVTASAADSKTGDAQDWNALAAAPGTLVMLMGWRALGDAAAALIGAGKPADTPAAVISWGTEPYQKTATARLDNIAELAKSRGLSAPATAVVGEMVNLRERINWFESLPLLGKRVLLTRPREQSAALSRLLSDMGALPVEVPMIEIRPPEDWAALDGALADAGRFDWIAFTSANAGAGGTRQARRERLGLARACRRPRGCRRQGDVARAKGHGHRRRPYAGNSDVGGFGRRADAGGRGRQARTSAALGHRAAPSAGRADAGGRRGRSGNGVPDRDSGFGGRRACGRSEGGAGRGDVRKLVGGPKLGRALGRRRGFAARRANRLHRPNDGGYCWKIGAES